MAVKSFRVGPGLLTFGATGTPVDFTAQVTACKVTWSKDKDDDVPTLSGDTLSGATTYTATLEATLVQDLSDDGLVDWSWTNKGTEVPFEFVPSTAEGKSITGTVVVDPIDVGGDVRSKPTSDISWDCVGEPALAASL